MRILGIFVRTTPVRTWTRINDDTHQFGLLMYVAGDPRVYGRCYIASGGRGIFYGEPANSDTTDNPATFNFSPGTGDSLNYFYQNITAKWSRATDPQGKPLTYIMQFFGPGVDTTISTSDTTKSFTVGRIQPLSRYVLTGWISNGFDTTASENAIWFNSESSLATDVRKSSTLPTSFMLHQNFPNPFNPTTTIEYELPNNSRVTLSVYDILGRELVTLVDGEETVGNHEVSFDASRFASGIYFYRIETPGFTKVMKMVLIK